MCLAPSAPPKAIHPQKSQRFSFSDNERKNHFNGRLSWFDVFLAKIREGASTSKVDPNFRLFWDLPGLRNENGCGEGREDYIKVCIIYLCQESARSWNFRLTKKQLLTLLNISVRCQQHSERSPDGAEVVPFGQFPRPLANRRPFAFFLERVDLGKNNLGCFHFESVVLICKKKCFKNAK